MSTPLPGSRDGGGSRDAGARPTAPLGSAPPAASLSKHCSTCGARYPADFLLCPRDATPLTADAVEGDPLVGQLLGETYQIVRVVGEGGMGRVYEARHLRLKDKRFAVKVLHPELARQPEVVARFQREAESASAIGHDNVVDVLDVYRTLDGRPYLVAEFLEGIELGDYLTQQKKLPPVEAVHIVRQVCRALGAAHDKGIVHRDVKPENVFITPHDEPSEGIIPRPFVKVIDFGISKAQEGSSNLTRTGMIMGTPSYMAPEQARGEAAVDRRADVYSVGALLYHLVTGKKPFDSEDPAAILGMVLTAEPPRPRAIDASVPEALELVIQRAMAKDPAERYATMRELDVALAPFDGDARLSAAVAPGEKSTDPTARTVLAGMAATPAPSAGGAKMARPTVALMALLLTVWLTCGFVDALAGIVRWFHAGELTMTESVLLMVGGVLAAATPAVLFVIHLKKNVWQSSVKALELAGDMKRTAVGALVTYGAAAFAARVAFTVIMRDSHELAGGLWDASLFVASAAGAIAAGGIGPLARRARRRKLRA